MDKSRAPENAPSGDREAEEEMIARRIVAAIMESRLPPGTKLAEAALCEAFGVGRMRIRRVLLLLSSWGMVELRSNRGAFVASPSAGDAADVFEARRAIEPAMMPLVIQRAGASDLRRLNGLLRQERASHDGQARGETIRLSGEFHVALAELTGNGVLTRLVRDLVARSSLIIGLYGSGDQRNCADGDHERLVEAITGRDAAAAARLMASHLRDIQAQLDLSPAPESKIDLRKILAG